jgi:hypothetical protein
VIINKEWVLRFFGTTHMIAKADRTQNWLSPEQQVAAMDNIKIFVHERWHGRDRDALFRIGTWELFQLGLTLRGHLQCSVPRARGQQVEILIIEQKNLYNRPVQGGEQQFNNRSVLDG